MSRMNSAIAIRSTHYSKSESDVASNLLLCFQCCVFIHSSSSDKVQRKKNRFSSLTVIGRNVPVEVVRERLSSGAPEHVQVSVVRHHGVTVALLWRRGRPAQDVFRRDPPPTTSTKTTDHFSIQIQYFQLEFTLINQNLAKCNTSVNSCS